MGLVSGILGLPFAPIRAVLSLGELIQRRVEEELHDPSAARRRLEELERARAEGELSDEEVARAEEQVLAGMIGPPGTPTVPSAQDETEQR